MLLQKKIEEYDRRKREVEGQLEVGAGAMGGAGQKVKDGIKQVFGTATRPVEKFAHLVGAGQAAAGHRHTTAPFGSADNLSSLSSNESLSRSGAGHHHPHRPGSHTGR